MSKEKLIDQIVSGANADSGESDRYRQWLVTLPVTELDRILDEQNLERIRAEARRQVAANPRVIAAEQLAREKWEELQWANIFHTAINGRVLVDNQATRAALRSLIDESKGDQIGVQWFKEVAGSPALASCWQSAKVLDPKYQKQVAAAQDQQDRETFRTFAKANGFADIDANFHLAKSVLGSGFEQSVLTQAAQSGLLQLAPATQEELAAWAQEAYEARVDHLQNYASPEELRQAARQEAEQRREALRRAEQERQIYGREVADQAFGFPPLPTHNAEGQAIDAAYLNRISNTDLPLFKALMRKHGAAALTRRLNGRG